MSNRKTDKAVTYGPSNNEENISKNYSMGYEHYYYDGRYYYDARVYHGGYGCHSGQDEVKNEINQR